MDKQLLRKALLGGIVIFTIHLVFVYLDVYWVLPGADILIHFLAGLIVAYIPLSFVYPKHKQYVSRAAVILAVLSVSFLWEWYERVFGFALPLSASLYDTVIDVGAALIGGVCAYMNHVKA